MFGRHERHAVQAMVGQILGTIDEQTAHIMQRKTPKKKIHRLFDKFSDPEMISIQEAVEITLMNELRKDRDE